MPKQIDIEIKESESDLKSLLNSQTKITSTPKSESFIINPPFNNLTQQI